MTSIRTAVLLIVSVSFLGCGIVGSDDNTQVVEECPVKALSWSAKEGCCPPDAYDKVYAQLQNASDNPVQLKDGRMTYTLIDEQGQQDVKYSVSICCSTTDEKLKPGEKIQTYDIWPHVELYQGSKSSIFDNGYASPQYGAPTNIKISNSVPCKMWK